MPRNRAPRMGPDTTCAYCKAKVTQEEIGTGNNETSVGWFPGPTKGKEGERMTTPESEDVFVHLRHLFNTPPEHNPHVVTHKADTYEAAMAAVRQRYKDLAGVTNPASPPDERDLLR